LSSPTDRSAFSSFTEFVTAPYADIATVAPETMVYAASGTRRSAVLAGVDVDSSDYFHWAHVQMLEAFGLIFRHGVRNLFTVVATPGQFQESGAYRDQLVEWIRWGTTGSNAQRIYQQQGWQVRLISDGSHKAIDELDEELRTSTTDHGDRVLWYLVVQDRDALWRRVLHSIVEKRALAWEDAIKAVYGQILAPASLYLGFGKPTVAPELLPPLLSDLVDCYWSQIPGYSLTERTFRSILYDHAYSRKTWKTEKAARAQKILDLDHDWERGPVLGLGIQVEPFWYPIWGSDLSIKDET